MTKELYIKTLFIKQKMHHWNTISIKNEYETVLQWLQNPFSSSSSIQDLVETVIVLNCKQVSFLIEQDLHLNIAITSLIWLTMLESDNLKKFFVGSKYLLFFFFKGVLLQQKFSFSTKAS